MRHARIVLGTVAALVLASAPASAQGGPFDRVTGGGQVILSADAQGAGDTIAFAALELPRRGDTGEVQYVPTSTGAGSQEYWHGRVTCLEVDGTEAVFGGRKTIDGGEPDGTPFFEIYVQDNGEQGTDLIAIAEYTEEQADQEGEPNCEFEPEETDQLARGNLTVHDAA